MNKFSLIKGIIHLTFSSFLFMLSGYFVNVWLGRNLSVEEYGLYGIVISLIGIVNITQAAGIPQAVSKFIAQNINIAESVYKSGFILQVISNLLVAALFMLFANPVSVMLNDKALSELLFISAFIFPLYGIYALNSGYFNGIHNFKKQAMINNIYYISKIVFVIGMAYLWGLIGAVWGFVLSSLPPLIIGFKLPKLKIANFPLKKLAIFSLPLIGFSLLFFLLQTIDLLLIKHILNSNQSAGYYTAAQNIARIPFVVLSSFSLVLLPSISTIMAEKRSKDKAARLINLSLRAILIVILPITVALFFYSDEIIRLIFSDKYIAGSQALSYLSISFLFYTLYNVLSFALQGAHKPQVPFFTALLGVFLTVFSCFILIPKYQILGAALAGCISGFTILIITASIALVTFKSLVQLKTIFRLGFSTLLIVFFNIYFGKYLGNLTWVLLFNFVIYLSSLILFGEIRTNDLREFLKIARLKKK